ncbi:MAG: response regulator [Ekhidna sp.]
MKILIVEDNEINAKLLNIMLKDLEFDASTTLAPDAKSALKESEDQQYDLVLMDINLGDGLMDGTEVMKVLKAKEQYKKVPIYAITCYSLPGDKERFLEAGFDKYFSKPVEQKPLLSAINEDKPSTE